MNNSKSFTRKIIYIVLIAALLIPLSLVSRPATRDPQNDRFKSGGYLAELRDRYDLSQAKMTEIDPASETMKLASLGLRGVAVNMLWMQAIEHKKRENWDQLESTLNALVKIQPNFIKVWEYQAHNLSYNISMEFDDFEYRYHWVKKGIHFLTKGLKPNYRDHRMTDNLGFFTGMKIGISDEKRQFRRLFRKDDEFHSKMETFDIEPDSYFVRDHGHDNWALAYQWYTRSRNLVLSREQQFTGDIMFFRKRPSQLYNEGGSLQEEFRSNSVIREVWAKAHKEWLEYGTRELGNTVGQVITLEQLTAKTDEVERKREELDKLAPEGTRAEFIETLNSLVEFNDEEQAAMDLPTDQRTDEQEAMARRAQARLMLEMAKLDSMVASKIPEKDARKANRIMNEIQRLVADIETIDKYQGTVNYRYWRVRTKAEMDQRCITGWQKMYDAQELQRQSIFDDEYQVDPSTGERTIVQKGAISTYKECYAQFAEVLAEYPKLKDGELTANLLKSMVNYNDMLKVAGLEWPDDFPLQDVVDVNAEEGGAEDLPTSEELRERRIDRAEDPDDMTNEGESESAEDTEGSDDSADDDASDGEEAGADESADESKSSGDENADETSEETKASGDESKETSGDESKETSAEGDKSDKDNG